MGAAQFSKCGVVEVSELKHPLPRLLTKRNVHGVEDGEVNENSKAKTETRSSSRRKSAKHFDTGRSACIDDGPRKLTEKLLRAARAGKYKPLVEAVQEGADIHCRSLRNQTPLMLVACSDKGETIDAMNFLIEAMADIEAKDEAGWTPLLHACRNSREDSVKHLLQANASVKARSADGKTAVMLAAMDGSLNLVHILLTQKAAIDKKDDEGCSALFFACGDGNNDLVKLLLNKSANARDKAQDNTTPLMLAAGNGSIRIGQKLVKNAEKRENKLKYINTWSTLGNTALMSALLAQQDEFANWLVDEGADVTRVNTDGEDAAEIADRLGMHSIKHRIELKAREATEAELASQ